MRGLAEELSRIEDGLLTVSGRIMRGLLILRHGGEESGSIVRVWKDVERIVGELWILKGSQGNVGVLWEDCGGGRIVAR